MSAVVSLWRSSTSRRCRGSRTENTPFFGPVVDIIASRIPGSDRITIQGADHVPQISMPDRYVELVTTFANSQRAIESR